MTISEEDMADDSIRGLCRRRRRSPSTSSSLDSDFRRAVCGRTGLSPLTRPAARAPIRHCRSKNSRSSACVAATLAKSASAIRRSSDETEST
jgi:hypothetical protein